MATPKIPSNTNQKPTGISLAERQKEAAKKLENQTIVVKEQVQTPVKLPEPTIITKVKSEESIPKKDRREELNRKTEEARKKLQEITTQTSENLLRRKSKNKLLMKLMIQKLTIHQLTM